MRLIKLSLWLVFTLFAPLCCAEVAQDLTQLLQPMHSLQANFTQSILDNQGRVIQKSIGKIALQRPGYFRWEVSSPIKQIIIANATRLWIYDPDLEQVVIKPAQQAVGGTPVFLLSNVAETLEKEFAVKALPNKVDWRWFSLVPKNKDKMFEAIQLGFYKQQIKEMRMQDSIGHSTVIEFKQVKTNLALSAALFNFKPPANVDVIDETKKSKK